MSVPLERVIYITAGAAGMYCGSCLHDNTLARALTELGIDVELIPTYTPILTDERNVSIDRVFFGGINVYLQQRVPLFRYLPAALDRFLDQPWLIRWATSRGLEIRPTELGALTVSMLRGSLGYQKKEVRRLCAWLDREPRPQIVNFTNILIAGCAPDIRKRLGIPSLVTLQGDDIFLEELPEPYKSQAFKEIRKLVKHIDGFIAFTHYYADFMADYLGIPRDKFHIIPLGLDTTDFVTPGPTAATSSSQTATTSQAAATARPMTTSRAAGDSRQAAPSQTVATSQGAVASEGELLAKPAVNAREGESPSSLAAQPRENPKNSSDPPPALRIGYLARLAPEKGLHVLVDAFLRLRQMDGMSQVRLEIAGWLGEHRRAYAEEQFDKLRGAGLAEAFKYHGTIDRHDKLDFLRHIDVLSVPTVYHEPKGLFLLEAWAAGVPVVQPEHGAFPEMLRAVGGGRLVRPNDPEHLAATLHELLSNPDEAAELGRRAREIVHTRFHARGMAEATRDVLQRHLAR